jgi:hypothetical protein
MEKLSNFATPSWKRTMKLQKPAYGHGSVVSSIDVTHVMDLVRNHAGGSD